MTLRCIWLSAQGSRQLFVFNVHSPRSRRSAFDDRNALPSQPRSQDAMGIATLRIAAMLESSSLPRESLVDSMRHVLHDDIAARQA